MSLTATNYRSRHLPYVEGGLSKYATNGLKGVISINTESPQTLTPNTTVDTKNPALPKYTIVLQFPMYMVLRVMQDF